MAADIKAFQDYLSLGFDEDTAYVAVPRNVPDVDGKNNASRYLLMNIEEASKPGARSLSAHALRQQFQEAAISAKDSDLILKNIAPLNYQLTAKEKNIQPETILREAEDKGAMFLAAGGAAFPTASMLVTDVRTMGAVYQYMFPETTEAQKAQSIRFTHHHEASHLMLGLQEPGSDFMAAALTLREAPQSRDMLRGWADMRLLQGVMSERSSEQYGSECHDAIERVLDMPPEQLQAMSIEQLYAQAKEYDLANERNNALGHSAEDNVRDSLKGRDVTGGLKFIWNKVSQFELPDMDEMSEHFTDQTVTPEDIESKIDSTSFPEGSAESKLADDVRESMTRARQTNMRFNL